MTVPPQAGGRVYLVGAGPGDPGLLTCRGREVLAAADVVVYDRLAEPVLAACCPTATERVYAGKGRGLASTAQAGINALLVARARAGQRVVRLKGGDPFVFGRGGEEAAACAAAGVPCEVVPGVSAAVAVPAYAGIPVTHRGLASSVAIVTGHAPPGHGPVDWRALARSADTLVVLMGGAHVAALAAALVAAGRPADTPAAVVSRGTLPGQRTIVADLASVGARAAAAPRPSILIVGEVVRLRDALAWFEARPLFGRRVLVTRAAGQADDLLAAVRELGGEPVAVPLLAPAAPASWVEADRAMAGLGRFAWVCFTSENGVRGWMERLLATGGDARWFGGARLAAVGRGTARSLRDYALVADVVPEAATAADLAAALGPAVRPGQRVLWVRGEAAGSDLPAGLAAVGVTVEAATVYRMLPDAEAAGRLAAALATGLDALTLASAGTVRRLLAAAGEPAQATLRRLPAVCIGPRTAAAARAAGLTVASVATEASVAGLAAALLAALGGG